MWLWWYSLCINLFLWLRDAGLDTMICAVPLIILVFYALYDLYCRTEDYEFDMLLLSIAICILVLVFVTDHIFLYFSVCLAILIFVYMIRKGKDILLYPPKFIRIANAISFISSIFTYITMYAAIEKELEPWVPLIPFGITALSEIIISWRVFVAKIEGLNDEFCIMLVYNRALFSLSTASVFIIAIVYVFDVVDSVYIFSFSTILYTIGLILNNAAIIKKIKCIPMYKKLQNDNINELSEQ